MNKLNQAYTMHPLFFDAVGKKAHIEEKDGHVSIGYIDDRPGVVVEENGDVTFNLYAPEAESVEVAGITNSLGQQRISLAKGEGGYFSRTVSGIRPGFHYHNWFVDGVKAANPTAPFCYGCFGAVNFFEVHQPGSDFFEIKDVPHGDVQIHKYDSQVNNHVKSCYVYLPPSYDHVKDRYYPVLYLQHGVGENETGWIWNGKLNFIMDNLIDSGKCEEMIVVTCSGYAFCDGEDPVFYPGDFDRELTGDCIAYIERNFRVKKGRKNRAMAGLSLGSAQAALAVSKHMDLFAYLGVFSGVRYDCMEQIMENNDRLPMEFIFLSCGVGEQELVSQQKAMLERLTVKNIPCEQRSYTGFHEWHVWRESLRDFVQKLFRHPSECGGCGDLEPEFPLNTPEISIEQLDRQTFEAHMLFFDPVYKDLIREMDAMGRPAGRYKDIRPGVEIVGQGCARFRLQALGARTVEVDILGMGRFPLDKLPGEDGKKGCFEGVVSEIEPGFHYHSYYINGTQVVNNNAPVGYGCFQTINYFEMPEPDFEEYRLRQVPHGAIHLNYYKSGQTGRTKLCYVYTPPAYDKNQEMRYPVLYLQHGGGENEVGWVWQGKIANIADNLLAQGQMKEMIIVMNTGYAFPEHKTYHPSMSAFLDELPLDCVPFIDQNYRTLNDRKHRAVAGLSMGGMQTQKIAFHHPELFAWAGIFSGGLVICDDEEDYRDILYHPEAFREQFEMLFVGIGTQEGFYESTMESIADVLKHQVPIEVFADYGYHDWTFWRHCAKLFLRKLFK